MNDLVAAELLVLFMLLLPILRPFIPTWTPVSAISVLPVAATALCGLIIIGYGWSATLIILIVFSLLCLLVESKRIVLFAQNLHTHMYHRPARMMRLFLMLAFFGLTWLIFANRPEKPYYTKNPIHIQDLYVKYRKRIYSAGRVLKPAAQKNNPLPAVLVFSENPRIAPLRPVIQRAAVDFPSGVSTPIRPHGGTIARVGADWGFTVAEIDTEVPHVQFLKYIQALIPIFPPASSYTKNTSPINMQELEQAVTAATQEIGGNFFIFAEGETIKHAVIIAKKNPTVAGIFLVYSENTSPPITDGITIPVYTCELPQNQLPEFADLRGNDPLAARLIHTEPDYGRKDRIDVAKKLYNWIESITQEKK